MTTRQPSKSRPAKTIHLVCNAHLDPVWQWTWEDGLAEAVSTFRVAADFCDRFRGFVFNHNESVLYAWVQRHDPKLFARIQRLVKAGRWHIAGGSFLQPDVNTPGGESHIRQYLLGLSFFRRHFGRRPTTAYNFDPFGHPEGFVQVLAGCGMDSYIFCRPDFGTYDPPVGAFRWRDRSGAEVLARRSDDHYLTRPDTPFQVDKKFPRFLEHYKDEPVTMLLWGIGNHGGGPSREEYRQVREQIKAHPRWRFVESTPEGYFAAVRAAGGERPVVQGEIEHSFPGCYSSMARVKRAHRAAEHLMAQAERLAALAWWHGGVDYPKDALDACWRDILFCEFHDILPGSGTPQAEQDALATLGGVHDRLRRLRFETVTRLLRGERPARPGDVPLFITNPHGFPLRVPVEFDYMVAAYERNEMAIRLRRAGRDLPCQRLSPPHNLSGQGFVRLTAVLELKPFEVARVDAALVPGKPMLPRPLRATPATLRFTTPRGLVQINPRTGLIDALRPAGSDRSLVKPGALRPVVFGDLDHSWTCGDPTQMPGHQSTTIAPAWRKPTAWFRLATAEEAAALSPLPVDKWTPGRATAAAPVRVVEHGDLRTTIEALFVLDRSYLNRHYVICHATGRIEVRDRVSFAHKDALLALTTPLGFAADHSRSESLYSVARRPPTPDYEQRHHQRWTAAVAADGAYLALATDGSFAHALTDDTLAITLMRSPAYTSFCMRPDDPYNDRCFAPRQDQGEHELRHVLDWGTALDEAALTRLADTVNAPPFTYAYFPAGGYERSAAMALRAPMLSVSPSHVRVVAVKRAEAGAALVVRLQEQAGRATRGKLRLGTEAVAFDVAPFALATLLITRTRRGIKAQPCNLVEGL